MVGVVCGLDKPILSFNFELQEFQLWLCVAAIEAQLSETESSQTPITL